MPEFDFDIDDSSLRVGLEVEYPVKESGDELLVDRGGSSSGLQTEVSSWPAHIGGHATYDGTVGLEVVSEVLHPSDAPQWYRAVLEHIEEAYGAEYQPTGLLKTGSTAGLHMHISSLTEEQARELYEISQEPWAKVLFCSSIANSDGAASWPVFRGGQYCRMQYGSGHYDVVNSRGNGRYEWRLPEPMLSDHVDVVMKFLRLFEHDPDVAREYAQGLLNDGDERITSIARAERVGMDIDSVPTVRREAVGDVDADFFDTVANDWMLPEIYSVRLDDETYYLFESDMTGTIEVSGVQFHTDDVLYADTLEPAGEAASREVRRAYEQRDTEQMRETEATKELKEIVKKKK